MITKPSAPQLSNVQLENQNGGIVLTGVVTSDYDVTLCTVHLTSSVPEFNNVTLTVALGDYFSYIATPVNHKSGSLRVIAKGNDGVESQPVDLWIG